MHKPHLTQKAASANGNGHPTTYENITNNVQNYQSTPPKHIVTNQNMTHNNNHSPPMQTCFNNSNTQIVLPLTQQQPQYQQQLPPTQPSIGNNIHINNISQHTKKSESPVKNIPKNYLTINVDNDQTHKYRLAIDIRAIRDLNETYHILCKYKFNLFGDNKPFISNPPLSVQHTVLFLFFALCFAVF